MTRFRLNPASAMKPKVGISETGMATAVTAVARQSRRNSQTTRAASAMPSSIVSRVAEKLPRVASTWETILRTQIVRARWLARRCASQIMPLQRRVDAVLGARRRWLPWSW